MKYFLIFSNTPTLPANRVHPYLNFPVEKEDHAKGLRACTSIYPVILQFLGNCYMVSIELHTMPGNINMATARVASKSSDKIKIKSLNKHHKTKGPYLQHRRNSRRQMRNYWSIKQVHYTHLQKVRLLFLYSSGGKLGIYGLHLPKIPNLR